MNRLPRPKRRERRRTHIERAITERETDIERLRAELAALDAEAAADPLERERRAYARACYIGLVSGEAWQNVRDGMEPKDAIERAVSWARKRVGSRLRPVDRRRIEALCWRVY